MNNQEADLIGLIERDLGPGKKSGRWVFFRCPFHQDSHPSLAVTNGDGQRGPYWRCWSTACDRHGGAVGWLVEYRQMTKQEAWQVLGSGVAYTPGKPIQAEEAYQQSDYPPGPDWQERAWQVIRGAEAALWSEEGANKLLAWPEIDQTTGEVRTVELSALDWLLSRGLKDSTLKLWHVGYIPKTWKEDARRWGLAGDPVIVPQGILIPCFLQDKVWYLKVRRPCPKPHKYIQIRGGSPALYLVQSLEWQEDMIFCEGELDALLLWQEAGDMAGVVTLGSAGNPLNVTTWGVYLLGQKRRFIAYDTDQAGKCGGSKLDWLHPQYLTVPQLKPGDKDLTDFSRSGGDLRQWLLLAMSGEVSPVSPQEGLRAAFPGKVDF